MIQKFEFCNTDFEGAYLIKPFCATDVRGAFIKDYSKAVSYTHLRLTSADRC